MLRDDFKIVSLMGTITEDRDERENLLTSLVIIFEEKNKAIDLLKKLTGNEIEETGNL